MNGRNRCRNAIVPLNTFNLEKAFPLDPDQTNAFVLIRGDDLLDFLSLLYRAYRE
jgi:hypothetical protein